MDCCPTSSAETGPSLNVDELALLCKALGHPARVKLVRHLVDVGGCFFGSLAEVVGLAPSTTSQHVSILKEAGLISGSSDDKRVCYCINRGRLEQLRGLLALL